MQGMMTPKRHMYVYFSCAQPDGMLSFCNATTGIPDSITDPIPFTFLHIQLSAAMGFVRPRVISAYEISNEEHVRLSKYLRDEGGKSIQPDGSKQGNWAFPKQDEPL